MFRSILIGHFLILTYPRSRGESLQFLHHACAMSGSSPLTLGKLEGVHADLPDVRLIPAHAGKTSADPRGAASSPAHPRSRRENIRGSKGRSIIAGSSPLMRGKHRRRRTHQRTDRLIPTHAGETVPKSPTSRPAPAHPRSRGENAKNRGTPPRLMGSSPLTRGKHRLADRLQDRERLIPAHAGKTCSR